MITRIYKTGEIVRIQLKSYQWDGADQLGVEEASAMREFVRVCSNTALRRQNDPCDLWSTLNKLTLSLLMCNYFFVHQLLSLSLFFFIFFSPFFLSSFSFDIIFFSQFSLLSAFSLLLYPLLHQIPDYQGRNCEL
ncbi:hypothetical protein ABFS82_07G098500 [Erythranthe guttata]